MVLEFPKLGFELTLNSQAFSIGSFSVAWYGVIIAVGFLLALWYGLSHSKQYGINPDKMIDVVIGGIIGGIIGARLYYVLFSWSDYKDDLLSIFKIWNGGLAIYGGIIGAVLVGGLVCKWRKVKFPAMLDVAGLGFLIGQSVGRWGNFVNIEAYGCNTDLPWGMWSEKIVNDYYNGSLNISDSIIFDPYSPVHPCFLYESLWCILGFVLIHFLWTKRRKFDGEIFLGYLAWYGAGRFFIEGLRTDSLMIGSTRLRVSQLLAGLLVLVSVIMIIVIRSRIRRSGDPEYLLAYVKTEAWQEELRTMEEEARLYKERKERKKAGLPLDDEAENEYEVTEDSEESEEETEEAEEAVLDEQEHVAEDEAVEPETDEEETEEAETEEKQVSAPITEETMEEHEDVSQDH
ncbi:MAG: prolipoprotein diacylglyceryl transferase [Clostridiales bacterium]|nr:prolipoprotein diacylglyceryl transferase [Clostridiales bacterium]